MKNISKIAMMTVIFASGANAAFADPIIATKGYVDGGLATKADASSLGTAAVADVADFDAAGTAAAAVAAAAGNYATAAQGATADSALQSGDNVSELNNDAGYLTSANVSSKADKAVPVAAGNLAGLDASGNLTDSGVAAGDVVDTTALNSALSGKADASALAGKQNNIGGGSAGTVITNTGVSGTVGALDVDSAVSSGSNNLVTSGAVHSAISAVDTTAKADKVGGAVNGNLAGLDASGNLTDSGVAASGVATTSAVNVALAGKQDALAAGSNQILWADGTGVLTWVSVTSDTYP